MSDEQARVNFTRCAAAQFGPHMVRALLSLGVAELRRIAGPPTVLAASLVAVAAPAQATAS